jgi:hypothetical protein
VRTAALRVQAEPQWRDNPDIQTLTFSDGWITDFLERQRFRRKQITREDKKVPSGPEIVTHMKIGQDTYKLTSRGAANVWNMDETALTYAIGPTHIYSPWGTSRESGSSDSKLRVTGIVTVNGIGEFAPTMVILKHSKSSLVQPDQRSMKVVKNMHKANDGFGIDDGWELKEWKSKTELIIPGLKGAHWHYCNYIIHRVTGEVITSQVL